MCSKRFIFIHFFFVFFFIVFLAWRNWERFVVERIKHGVAVEGFCERVWRDDWSLDRWSDSIVGLVEIVIAKLFGSRVRGDGRLDLFLVIIEIHVRGILRVDRRLILISSNQAGILMNIVHWLFVHLLGEVIIPELLANRFG